MGMNESDISQLKAYLKDNIYLFSTLDDVVSDDDMAARRSSIVPRNSKSKSPPHLASGKPEEPSTPSPRGEDENESQMAIAEGSDEDEQMDLGDLDDLLGMVDHDHEAQCSGVPLVHPRRMFKGHRSRDTIKDGMQLQIFSSDNTLSPWTNIEF